MLTDESQVFLASLVIRTRENLAIGAQPLDQPRAMASTSIIIPIGRIGTAETKQDVLRCREVEAGAQNLDDRNHDVQIEEEVQVDMRNAKFECCAVTLELNSDRLHVTASEDADRRFCRWPERPIRQSLAFAKEHALHMREE